MSVETTSAATLAATLLGPLYPREHLARHAELAATDANPGNNPAFAAAMQETSRVFSRLAGPALGRDDLELDESDASVLRLSDALTRDARDRLLRERGPDGAPLLAHVVVHAVAYLGSCVVRRHGGAWRFRDPLWESRVALRSRAGDGELSILSWLLRALSDDEVGRGTLAERYRRYVEVPCTDPAALQPFLPVGRALPRLKRPRYDTLHRYLKAHLPELRDVGEHFPSPERLVELEFEWLDFVVLGDGRMLLMHGPASSGVHLMWLDAAGFVKSAYYPADAFPAHVVKVQDADRIALVRSLLGKELVEELLWWGP
ncbi:MAG: hypothetical protein IT374_23975 [Polyangiaceae bacterium]|nr:hypothetical protein [Polyangiaceae bacterium]